MATGTDVKDLEAAVAEVEAATAAVEANAPADLAKSLSDAIDRLERLEKGDFGDTAKAHNGNKADKSAPEGSGKVSGGYATPDSEEMEDGGKAKRSSNKAKPAKDAWGAANTEAKAAGDLGKGAMDEEEMPEEDDEDEDDEDKVRLDEAEKIAETKKSQAGVTEESIYKALTTGEGSDEYMQVVEASEAIAHQSAVFAKGFAAVSAQIEEGMKKINARIDKIEKSYAVLANGTATLLKSTAKQVEDLEVLKKTPVQPASGIVHTIVATEKSASSSTPWERGPLFKSIQTAMSKGDLDTDVGGRLLAKLDMTTPDKIWETLPESIRAKITGSNAGEK